MLIRSQGIDLLIIDFKLCTASYAYTYCTAMIEHDMWGRAEAGPLQPAVPRLAQLQSQIAAHSLQFLVTAMTGVQ